MTTYEKFLRIPELKQITGLSRSTIYELRKKGELVPVKLGERAIAYRASDVAAWQASRKAA